MAREDALISRGEQVRRGEDIVKEKIGATK
jgi:hypothetical protein